MKGGSKLVASNVIIAAPPKSVWEHIEFSPALQEQQLMKATHTWMADSSKFTVVLDNDYWRKNNLSGFVYSNYGLIREMQDHNSADGKTFRLVGFIQPEGDLKVNFNRRKEKAINELKELFNIKDENIIAYDDFLWGEHYTGKDSINYNEELMPHQNNGHPFYQKPHFDHHLFFAGAETSASNPGYMEGAVGSAYRTVDLLIGK